MAGSPELEDSSKMDAVAKHQPEAMPQSSHIAQRKIVSTQSSLRRFFAPLPRAKRPLQPSNLIAAVSTTTHTDTLGSSSSCSTISFKARFTQLHLTHLPLLHTCKECGMSFVRGGEDESLHEKHHARVARGIIWDGLGRKGKSKETGIAIVRDGVVFGKERGGRGKVVMCDGSLGGSKVSLHMSRWLPD